MKISEMLKEKRKEYQLTQEQVAEKIFVSRKTISNWETEKTIPDIESVIRLAHLFDLSLDNLLLEGSDVVKNIKKQERIVTLIKWQILPISMMIIFVLIHFRLNYIGFEDKVISIILLLAQIINIGILYYFHKQIKNERSTKK